MNITVRRGSSAIIRSCFLTCILTLCLIIPYYSGHTWCIFSFSTYCLLSCHMRSSFSISLLYHAYVYLGISHFGLYYLYSNLSISVYLQSCTHLFCLSILKKYNRKLLILCYRFIITLTFCNILLNSSVLKYLKKYIILIHKKQTPALVNHFIQLSTTIQLVK